MPQRMFPTGYRNKIALLLGLAFLLASISACTTTPAISEQFRRQANLSLDYADIKLNTDAHVGEQVILGGYVLEVMNQPDQSQLLVLQTPLDYRSEPMNRDLSQGRFLVRTSRFLDPEVYGPGRKITVGGTVAGSEKQKIGEIDYPMPVIESRELTLWAEEKEYYRARPYYYWPHYPYYPDPYYYYRYPYGYPFKHPHLHP